MAKVTVYNAKGDKSNDIEIKDSVFAVEPNQTLVHQVYLALQANARQPWADTKDKSEVRGGGKKPWKQKGTGRARHGSIRSPIWKGGGVTFGPLSIRNYKQKINKKMNRKAVAICLSDKVQDQKFIVLENFGDSGKTKEFAALMEKLPRNGKSTIILTNENNENLFLASRNIPKVHLQRAQDVNVADLLHHQYVITTKEGIEVLENRLS
ncbi:50S ribosomal protein L4 [Candidatus Nomurabacteria bacterium]|nr:50S ribosomal protein L4 [Candidatus Nomurabacteria bacterium]